MSWPTDFFYANAPGYSFSGSFPWPGGSSVLDNFMSACGAYEATGKADASAKLSEGWVPTGQTHTGTAAPATPADTYEYAVCGSGQRNTQALIGNNGITTIQIDFYAKKLKKEYRWVQDSPYIPGGTACWEAAKLSGSGSAQGDPAPNRAWDFWMPAANAAMGSLAISSSESTYRFLKSQYPSATDLQYALIAILNPQAQAFMDAKYGAGAWHTPYFGYPNPVYYRSLWSRVEFIYSIVGSYYSAADLWTYISPAVNGQWHLESRYVIDSPSQKCGTAYYMKAPFDLSDGSPNAPRAKYTSRLSASMPSGEGNGTMRLGTHCNTVTYTSGADIWDPLVANGSFLLPQGYTIAGAYHPAVEWSYTVPGGPIAIQQGSPLLGYNTLKGALVYDMDLKKWGKWKQDYSILVEFTGMNASNASSFSYTDLGMTAGLLHSDGLIYLFDQNPTDSFIRYGKIGYYRLGMVHFLESRIDFRTYATGSLTIDFSMDGRNLDSSLQQVYNYNSQLMYRVYPNQRARWMTLKISGNYDLQYMEIRGNISCRR